MFVFRNKSSQELDVEESQIAANYAAITAYNGPLRWGWGFSQLWVLIIWFRKFSAEIPETITEDEWNIQTLYWASHSAIGENKD